MLHKRDKAMSIGDLSGTQPVQADGISLQALPASGGMPSWQTRCIMALFRFLPGKKHMASAEAVQEHVRRLAQRPAPYKPTGLGRGIEVSLKTVAGVAGWPVYYTAPSANPNAGNYVLFLHGGGFINEIVPAHWRFIADLTRHAGVRCVVPIYPLTPRATAKDLVPATGELLRRLMEEAGPARVTVIGNSAGAGLGLAATQWLRDAGCRQPDRLILISPWVNASVTEQHRAIAAQDPMQDIPGIVEMARLYAGDLDINHPYVSPLRGDLRELAPMLIFTGTRDLLYPDSLALANEARAAGVAVELHLRQGQPHNYPCMPTPEGAEARSIIRRVSAQGLK
jgi:epsilon-lactone hydrolase